MEIFYLNQTLWKVYYISSSSAYLIDRTGKRKLATTDVKRKIIFIDCTLTGDTLFKVILHEISHAAIDSYGLLKDIYGAVNRSSWVNAEEWLCNYLYNYGLEIINSALNAMPGDFSYKYPY